MAKSNTTIASRPEPALCASSRRAPRRRFAIKPSAKRLSLAFDAVRGITFHQLLGTQEESLDNLCDLLDFSAFGDAFPSYTVSGAKRATWGEVAGIACEMRLVSDQVFHVIAHGVMVPQRSIDRAYELRAHADRLIFELLRPVRALAGAVSSMRELPVDFLKVATGCTTYSARVLHEQHRDMIASLEAQGFTHDQARGLVELLMGATCSQLWAALESRLDGVRLTEAVALERRAMRSMGTSPRWRERSVLNAYAQLLEQKEREEGVRALDSWELIAELNARFMLDVLAPLGLLSMFEAADVRAASHEAAQAVESTQPVSDLAEHAAAEADRTHGRAASVALEPAPTSNAWLEGRSGGLAGDVSAPARGKRTFGPTPRAA